MVQCQCFKPRSSDKSGAPGLLRMRGRWIWCDLDLLWLNPLICLGALETITMPLGKWLKDLLVNKRASLEDFRNWRCLLVTLYCSCCTANCKEKNNTYNIPEEREREKKTEREGHWNIFHDSFLIHVQMVSVDISNMLSILLCASFSVFFSNYSHHQCEWVCRKRV